MLYSLPKPQIMPTAKTTLSCSSKLCNYFKQLYEFGLKPVFLTCTAGENIDKENGIQGPGLGFLTH